MSELYITCMIKFIDKIDELTQKEFHYYNSLFNSGMMSVLDIDEMNVTLNSYQNKKEHLLSEISKCINDPKYVPRTDV